MPTAKPVKPVKVPRVSRASEEIAPEENSLHTFLSALPAPEELAKYEKIVPGGAERILELAEHQATHRQEVEARRLETAAKATRARQLITFVLALGVAILGGALLLQGSELAGLMIILIDAISVALVAVYARDRE